MTGRRSRRRCWVALIGLSGATACGQGSPVTAELGADDPPPSVMSLVADPARPDPSRTDAGESSRAGTVELFRPRLTFEHVSSPGAMRPVATVGRAAPFSMVRAGVTGRWVALCQGTGPTSSDAVAPHGEVADGIDLDLVVEAGEGVRVGALAADPTGRWILAMRGSSLELRDTAQGVVTRLPAGAALTEQDTGSLFAGRAASFDPGGSHAMYLRGQGDQLRAVVRDLRTGRETAIDPGKGNVWRSSLTDGGRWARFEIIDREPPHQSTSLSSDRCRGPARGAYGGRTTGDAPVTRFVAVASGRVVEGAIAALGERLIRRTDSGALELIDADGRVEPIVPAACDPRILWGDHGTERLVVDCRRDRSQATINVFVRGGRALLEGVACHLGSDSPRLALAGVDHLTWSPQARLLACYSGGALDLRDATFVQSPDARVLATFRSAALVATADRLSVIDVDDRTEDVLARGAFDRMEAVSAGPIAAVGGLAVDMTARTLLGTYDGLLYGVSADGRVLVGPAATVDRGSFRLPRGPLTWRR